eukprot:CAMPEP_0115342022 /NCGR_PEP_ID=MMETSP0270-20121206/91990_1 /TAXON_ID=71861 /ORGANISM="Scrippsiella trochoidea, Strain CCMP3099" /LENGTH=49 /DNA_ID= /DNA_START= /DNA_END= /DNA_ORIENTATION=
MSAKRFEHISNSPAACSAPCTLATSPLPPPPRPTSSPRRAASSERSLQA